MESGSHGELATVVNVLQQLPVVFVIVSLFPLIRAAVFIGLLLQAFRMIKVSYNGSTASKADRRGLCTVHLELFG